MGERFGDQGHTDLVQGEFSGGFVKQFPNGGNHDPVVGGTVENQSDDRRGPVFGYQVPLKQRHRFHYRGEL